MALPPGDLGKPWNNQPQGRLGTKGTLRIPCLPHTLRGREVERLMRFSQSLHGYQSSQFDAAPAEVSDFFHDNASKSTTKSRSEALATSPIPVPVLA